MSTTITTSELHRASFGFNHLLLVLQLLN